MLVTEVGHVMIGFQTRMDLCRMRRVRDAACWDGVNCCL